MQIKRLILPLILLAPLVLAAYDDFDDESGNDCRVEVASLVTLSESVFTFRVKDDSMSPMAEAGDCVVASRELPFVSGTPHLISFLRSGDVIRTSTIRIVEQVECGYKLTAIDPAVPPVLLKATEVIAMVPVVTVLKDVEHSA